jgi:hypothetical protein
MKLRCHLRRLRNLLGPDALHCIGDSHASFFGGEERMQPTWPRFSRDRIPRVRSYRIGPALAYNLTKEGTASRGRERLLEVLDTLPHGARVLLCFGEIDCRAHLAKQAARQQLPLADVVAACVARYLEAGAQVGARGFRVGYWQVPPPSLENIPDGEFPIEGSFEERLAITRGFNRLLAAGAMAQGQAFVSIFEKLTDAAGLPLPHYFLDGIHLSQQALPAALAALRETWPELDLPVMPLGNPASSISQS